MQVRAFERYIPLKIYSKPVHISGPFVCQSTYSAVNLVRVRVNGQSELGIHTCIIGEIQWYVEG